MNNIAIKGVSRTNKDYTYPDSTCDRVYFINPKLTCFKCPFTRCRYDKIRPNEKQL